MDKEVKELDTPMIPAPKLVTRALARAAPRLPHLSMMILANMLPKRPPIVNTEVTNENVASDIGMHVGSWPREVPMSPVSLHVRTAWIWLRAAVL